MGDFKLTYKPFGERSILIAWPNNIDTKILKDIISFKEIIEIKLYKEIVELNYAYNSILISYIKKITNFNNYKLELEKFYISKKTTTSTSSKLWKIPVCYDLSFGIDIEEIIEAKSISIDELILLHSNTIYTVFFIGFLPGFLYLGGLNERLNYRRKESPRLLIKKGSVAIGENQTGIYPIGSPGGWNIIGNSPINLFNHNLETPCQISGVDKLQFFSISLAEHKHIAELIKNDSYNLESEVYYD